ncbi:MAG: ABC transporter permease [Clostridiales bacterium]|nr:ABC transporter permease [Clostridiales bacterium]
MKTLFACVKRNTILFFKDKGLFFTSLITPLILLVLYSTFLSNVYKDSYTMIFESQGLSISKEIVDGLAGGQLMSSLLAVSCVTVSFCSNMLMVQDKVTGAHKDMLITPLKRSTLGLSYYISTTISTLIICLVALVACLIYVAIVGWYMTFIDVLLTFVDILLLVTFGTALSSVINYFLSSQGQISAVGSIVSSCYGFICGAYMPLSQLGEGLRNAFMFLPGTYGTALIRNHAMGGAIEELSKTASPEIIKALKDTIDCNIYFFDQSVDTSVMYVVVIASIVVLLGAYVLINKFAKKSKK